MVWDYVMGFTDVSVWGDIYVGGRGSCAVLLRTVLNVLQPYPNKECNFIVTQPFSLCLNLLRHSFLFFPLSFLAMFGNSVVAHIDWWSITLWQPWPSMSKSLSLTNRELSISAFKIYLCRLWCVSLWQGLKISVENAIVFLCVFSQICIPVCMLINLFRKI